MSSLSSSSVLNMYRYGTYLDDTYCGTSHRFPNQDLVLSQVKNAALREVSKYKRVLFLFGAYAIGKEKVFLSVANQFKESKIFVERSRSVDSNCSSGRKNCWHDSRTIPPSRTFTWSRWESAEILPSMLRSGRNVTMLS